MARFRKRPVEVEAFQMTKERRRNINDWPRWLNKAWNMPDLTIGALSVDPDDPTRERLVIGTLEGVYRISWGDWIIRMADGELSSCQADLFEATYEKIDNPVPKKYKIIFSEMTLENKVEYLAEELARTQKEYQWVRNIVCGDIRMSREEAVKHYFTIGEFD